MFINIKMLFTKFVCLSNYIFLRWGENFCHKVSNEIESLYLISKYAKYFNPQIQNLLFNLFPLFLNFFLQKHIETSINLLQNIRRYIPVLFLQESIFEGDVSSVAHCFIQVLYLRVYSFQIFLQVTLLCEFRGLLMDIAMFSCEFHILRINAFFIQSLTKKKICFEAAESRYLRLKKTKNLKFKLT